MRCSGRVLDQAHVRVVDGGLNRVGPACFQQYCPISFRNIAAMIKVLARGILSAMARHRDWLHLCASMSDTSHLGIGASIQGRLIIAGDRTVIESGALLDCRDGSIGLGAGSRIRSGARIYAWGGQVETGADMSLNSGAIIYGTGGVTIGNHVRIAANTVIVASSHVFSDLSTPIADQGHTASGIVIEDDVWIGANATILDGVVVGRGSVIAAGAVVNKNIAPFSVVGGVPARLIRSRSDR